MYWLYLSLKTLENDSDKYQTKSFNKRVKHLNDFGQIWGLLSSSSITCNIYKPLKRISLEGNDGALLPITSTKPSGVVTVDLMDPCDAEGFQSCCFGTRPLLDLSPSSAVHRKEEAWGVNWDNTPHKHCDVTLPYCWSYKHLIYSWSWEGQPLWLHRIVLSRLLYVLYATVVLTLLTCFTVVKLFSESSCWGIKPSEEF